MLLWLDDALTRLLRGQKLPSYIPNMDWNKVNRYHRLPKHLHHLLSDEPITDVENSSSLVKHETLIETVLRFLDVAKEEFSTKVPFISYGLDSLSASNLSFALQSTVELSQMQLLSPQMNFEFLQSQVESSHPRSEDAAVDPIVWR